MALRGVGYEITKRLGLFLKENMPSLNDVVYDFPMGNVDLDLPTLSIITVGRPNYLNELNPYVINTPSLSPGDDASHKYKWVVGWYEFTLQLDIWCGSKHERDSLHEELFQAFHKDPEKQGVNLTLDDYHEIVCRYDLDGYLFQDSEDASQAQEWRVKIDVLANCKAVIEKTDSAIIETEVTYEDL